MNPNRDLDTLLEQWRPEEPPVGFDERVLEACRPALRRSAAPSLLRRFWSARVSLPAPAFAALLLCLVAWWRISQPVPPPPQPPLMRQAGATILTLPGGTSFVTTIDAAGFQPIPDGAVRVIPKGEVLQ